MEAALSDGFSTPTRIFPSVTSGSYNLPPRPRRAVTTSVMTVARIAPSIVSSNVMIRFGHQANVGRPPTLIGHDVSVSHESPSALAMPISPPAHAIHQIHVARSIRPNS